MTNSELQAIVDRDAKWKPRADMNANQACRDRRALLGLLGLRRAKIIRGKACPHCGIMPCTRERGRCESCGAY